MRLNQFLLKFEGVRKTGHCSWHVICPVHVESFGSLHLTFFPDNRTRNGRVLGNITTHCFGQLCDHDQILAAVGLTERDCWNIEAGPGEITLGEAVTIIADLDVLAEYLEKVSGDIEQASAYVEERFSLDVRAARALGLGYDAGETWERPEGFKHLGDGRSRLVIPFRDPSGASKGVQARRIDPCEASERWTMPAGSGWAKIGCFGWELDPPIFITEGPTDAIAAVGAGFPALAVRGAANFKNKKVQDQIRDWLGDKPALIIGDNGETGVEAAETLAAALSLPVWYPPEGSSDLAEFLVSGGSLEDVVHQAQASQDPLEALLEEVSADLVGALRNEELLERLAELSRRDREWLFERIQENAPDRQQGRVDRQVNNLRAAVRELAPRRGGPAGRGNGREEAIENGDGRPVIHWDDNEQPGHNEQEIRSAMEVYEGDDFFWVAAGKYVKLGRDGSLVALEGNDIATMLGRMGFWVINDDNHITIRSAANEGVKIVTTNAFEPPLPYIARAVSVPFMLADGSIVKEPGYYQNSEVYMLPEDTGIIVPEVPEIITQEHLSKARSIYEEALQDFQFVDTASKTNAIAANMTHPLRELIPKGAPMVPMTIIKAPQSGSGKGTIADFTLSSTGVRSGEVETTAYSSNEEELEKKIVAELLSKSAHSTVFFDNVRTHLASAVIEQMLTKARYKGRTLGLSQVNGLSTLVPWLITLQSDGSLNIDLLRRCLPIEITFNATILNENGEQVWTHEEYGTYLDEHRGDLIWAAFVAARWWIQNGRPTEGVTKLLGYPGWTNTIGAIVTHALGYKQFLGNHKSFVSGMANQVDTIEGFIEKWYELYQCNPHPARTMLLDEDMLEDAALLRMLGLSDKASSKQVVTALNRKLHSKRGLVLRDGKHQWVSLGRIKYKQEGKLLQFQVLPLTEEVPEYQTR